MQSFEVIWELTHILYGKLIISTFNATYLTKIRFKVFEDQWDFVYFSYFTSLEGIFNSLFLDVFEALTQLSKQ